MNRKKAFALIILILVLVMIFSGILLTNNCTRQVTDQKDILSDVLVVPANETAYKKLELAASDQSYCESLTISTGTIRARFVAPENFSTWTNTSSLLGWSIFPSSIPTMGGSNNIVDGPMVYGPFDEYLVFWNPDSPVDKEVTIRIYQETTQTVYDYTTLGIGIMLIVTGSIIGIVGTLKLCKWVFLNAIAIVMIVSGAFLVNTYSSTIFRQEVVATESITVPANGYAHEIMRFNETGYYSFSSNQPINVNFTFIDKASFDAWQNGQYQPDWNSYYYGFTINPKNIDLITTYAVVLSNQNTNDTQVNYKLYRSWEEYNYAGLISGIALIIAGAVTVFLANRDKIKQFNKALESEQNKNKLHDFHKALDN